MKMIFVVVLAAAAGPAWAASTSCEDLAKLKLNNIEITSAKVVARGGFMPPQNPNGQAPNGGPNQSAALYANTPAFCRVQATMRPSADSDIKAEVWLPQEGWNGRLQAVGNGGYGSNISYNNLAPGVTAGYVMVSTNTGHEGNSGVVMIGHPEKFIDWGYRAVHESTVMAKTVSAAYYSSPVKYSYWSGCSTGGRQGLIAAEYYPNDFDGLSVGDAPNPMTRNQASTIYANLVMNKDAASVIPQAKFASYRKAVLDKCDAADGVKDGLLNNPMACKFDAQEMLCKGSDNDSCLTQPQASALNKLLAGMKNPRTGEQLHPGWPIGTVPANFVIGPKPEDVAVDTFRIVFNNADWDYHTMDFDKDIAKADKLGSVVIDAADPTRLKALFAHGGKLFLYHGWSDPAITALKGVDYYTKAMAANGGKAQTYDSMRLFMVPGMGHCGGGDGPNAFDKLEVITRWVEEGKAPDQIIASHSTSGQVDRTRPLCPYPQVAKYSGTGSIDEAANFSCAAP
jgi:Tannase and feruloyl esterase